VATFEAFRSWIVANGGESLAAPIDEGFQRVIAKYAAYQGDALPPVPPGFSSENPSETVLDTPFGQLYELVADESDPGRDGSLVQSMTAAANELGIRDLP
jgi:iron uptake system component EfeO